MNIIETERLFLQEVKLTDAEFIFQLLNSPTWLEFIGDRNVHSLEDAEKYIQKSLIDSYNNNGYGLYKMVLQATEEPIGLCGIINRPTLDHPDIGFAIFPKYANNGFTSEAAKATMEFATTKLQLHPILGITTEANIYSRRLLEKIGLKLSGTFHYEDEKESEELLLYSN